MSKLALYPNARKVEREDFKGQKINTIPSQSMTLKEIIRRFIRRESLPIERQGVYHEGLGDLEKMSKEDIHDQMERVESLKGKIKRASDKKKKDEEEKSKATTPSTGSPQVPPRSAIPDDARAVGEPLSPSPPPQGS